MRSNLQMIMIDSIKKYKISKKVEDRPSKNYLIIDDDHEFLTIKNNKNFYYPQYSDLDPKDSNQTLPMTFTATSFSLNPQLELALLLRLQREVESIYGMISASQDTLNYKLML
eukprot:Mrub_03469.p2 GENE.Mrub_03469~~Mrub_03469.p2  ORF type:complete len:113 (+),score=13.39 Mrub_03469:1031-1369(+)